MWASCDFRTNLVNSYCKSPDLRLVGSENSELMMGTVVTWSSSGLSSEQECLRKRKEAFLKRARDFCYDFLLWVPCSILFSPEMLSWVRGVRGLAPDGTISCSGLHSKLGASRVTVYVAGGVHSDMGFVASQIQRLDRNHASFSFKKSCLESGTAAVNGVAPRLSLLHVIQCFPTKNDFFPQRTFANVWRRCHN